MGIHALLYIVCAVAVDPFVCPFLSILCQMEEYKRRCTDLEAELAVQEIGAESNTQQVRVPHPLVHVVTMATYYPLLHSRATECVILQCNSGVG